MKKKVLKFLSNYGTFIFMITVLVLFYRKHDDAIHTSLSDEANRPLVVFAYLVPCWFLSLLELLVRSICNLLDRKKAHND